MSRGVARVLLAAFAFTGWGVVLGAAGYEFWCMKGGLP